MALAPFFDRIYGSLGGRLAVSREALESKLVDTVVGIRVGAPLTRNDRWIAELSINLLARLYPRIAISAPAPGLDQFLKSAATINTAIEFADHAPDELTIAVGPGSSTPCICASATGWVARRARSPSPSGLDNPYSAAAAAALAVAELFRCIFVKAQPTARDYAFSLLDFGSTTGADVPVGETAIGSVPVIGVGAVANAALWALSRDDGVEGELIVLDPQPIELSNLQRYVLTQHGDKDQLKVFIARDRCSRPRLTLNPVLSDLDAFCKSGDFRYPVAIVSVDNVDGRRAAQALLPKLLINGWTGEASLGASWHEFGSGTACLACLYHPTESGPSPTEIAAKRFGLNPWRVAELWVNQLPLSSDEVKTVAYALGVKEDDLNNWRGKPFSELYTDVVCGLVPLDLKGVGKIEMVPLAHQSALAGVLMAAEFIKRVRPDLRSISQPESLVSWEDVLLAPPTNWRKPRRKEEGCICGDEDYQRSFTKKWAA